ncbi:MAG TPA: pyridoxamine 5'-phosphate oxidase family protein [Burkholderiales bacterium]|nr:pyridoxamine 5'-phosphate oxidase family protein [Burkholderiales bacterium]
MAKRYEELTDALIAFIIEQKIYFVGSATADSRVNISPKGMNSLRILGKNRAVWLNVTGSGNETAAHVQINPRMTVMFCAFEGPPLIVRLYGSARVVHANDPEWTELYAHFEPLPGARQIFDLSIDLVQTSCGFGVPFYDYAGDRTQLNDWAIKKGEEGIQQYWIDKNQFTIDKLPTRIIEGNLGLELGGEPIMPATGGN